MSDLVHSWVTLEDLEHVLKCLELNQNGDFLGHDDLVALLLVDDNATAWIAEQVRDRDLKAKWVAELLVAAFSKEVATAKRGWCMEVQRTRSRGRWAFRINA